MANTTDPYGGLTGDNRNAAVALTNLFSNYGLGTLAGTIVKFLQQGYSADTITVLLQQTPEYKQRFAANDARLKAGLPVLSPAEYLQLEGTYRQVMSAYGLPKGFYDQPSDFTNWIAGDVSPQEVSQRVQEASDLVYNAPQETKDALKQFYGIGDQDLVAHFLDPKTAAPILQRQAQAANIAGVAANQGVANLNVNQAETLASAGVTTDQARQGFQAIGQQMPGLKDLGNIYGGNYSTDDAISEAFAVGDSAGATQKRKRLASQARASFSGSGGYGQGSLSSDTSGQF